MDKIHQVCSECKLFTNEDSFGDGWCEFHQKETFCENGACEDGIEIAEEGSSQYICVREYSVQDYSDGSRITVLIKVGDVLNEDDKYLNTMYCRKIK